MVSRTLILAAKSSPAAKVNALADEDEDELDNLNEIEEENILGSRTRGKNIDFAKAAEEAGDLDDEDDEDEDDDYEEPDEEMEH